jgi:hypothetical protein
MSKATRAPTGRWAPEDGVGLADETAHQRRERWARNASARRRRRIEAGLCVQPGCAMPPMPQRQRCDVHLREQVQRQIAYQEKRRANGQCTWGACPELRVGARYCHQHNQERNARPGHQRSAEQKARALAQTRARRAARLEAGLCMADGCPLRAVPQRRRCAWHLRVASRTARRYQRWRKAQGLCVYGGCDQPLVTKLLCARHKAKAAAKWRAAHPKKPREGCGGAPG